MSRSRLGCQYEPTGAGRIEPRELEQEMRTSFLDYSMSVIVSRALPDARDGLKPVHRRVLYAMNELGLQPNRERIKCARVVGDVMGKYHPHGNQAIYDALVRMAQPFSLRYPLVDPQGNFGNVDGYPAAAERYTEARLAAMAAELLRDIDQDTIDFIPNYDGSQREPAVLPARFPNLLVNGATGIAVGMATNIPPHNLSETIDAVIAMIDDADIDVERLSQHIKGPDFPTGGIILGREGIREAYRSGRGRIRVRGRAHIEELRGGKSAIIVSELPYGVKKGGDDGVISKIADLVRDGVLSEVAAHRDAIKDLSGKDGMRIYIELKRDAVPQVALNKLYQHTSLQTTFGYNAVALVDGVPRTLSLLELIRHYLDHQREVVTRRLKFELRNAVRRAHILEGYLIALDNIDAVIALIRASESTEAARQGLMARVRAQRAAGQRDPRDAPPRPHRARAQAAADRVRRPDGADRRAARDPRRDESRIDGVIREELLELKETYGRRDERRTEIVAAEGELELEDLIAEEDMVIAITQSGYIKRLPPDAYSEQRRGGVGVMGMELKEDDYIEHLFIASTHDYILFFTSVGKVYRLKVHELPLGSRQSKGRVISNLLPMRQDEQVRAVIQTRDFGETEFLLCATKNGVVKKTKLAEYNTPLKADGIIAIKMREGDELVSVRLCSPGDDILLVSRKGQAIRFSEKDARAMGRATEGVRGHVAARRGRGDRGRDRGRRLRPARRDRERLRQAHARLRVPAQGPRRAGRADDQADRGARLARRRAGRPRRLPGHADLHRGHRDQDQRRGRQAARPLDAGRHRDAPARRGELVSTLAPVVESDEDDDDGSARPAPARHRAGEGRRGCAGRAERRRLGARRRALDRVRRLHFPNRG